MNRRQSLRNKQLIAAAALALASSVAFGDDSSMSVLTGDSYAFFNNLEYRAGKFNVARGPQARERSATARTDKGMENPQKPATSGRRPALGARTGSFRDDTGA